MIPFTYAVTAGPLPPTLTLDPNTGMISHTLDTAGTYTFTITATDAIGCTGNQEHTIGVAFRFDFAFYDHYGRAELCFNSTTGEYQYTILTGAHAGMVFTGTAEITQYAFTLYVFGTLCNSGSAHCLTGNWNTSRYTASAVLRSFTPTRFGSSLFDANYTDSPACGGAAPK